MNLPKYSVVCLVIMLFLCPLYGMDNPVVRDNASIVWSLVLTHAVNLFDHAMINSLIVSKNHKNILLSTAQCRQKYLISKANNPDLTSGFLWNQWGSMCAQKLPVNFPDLVLYDLDQRERYLSIEIYNVPDSSVLDNNLLPIFVTWNNFYGSLLHQPRLWFNEFGGVSFFGSGNVKSRDGDYNGDIIEYYTSTSGRTGIAMCVARLKNTDIPLKIFLEFPHLLKAFLHSCIVHNEYDYSRVHSRTKVHYIEGVTIPKNYTEHNNYFANNMYDKFSQLPTSIRKVIEHKYKKQKKNNKNKTNCFG